MTHDQLMNELNYSISLKLIRRMLELGLITSDEYYKIDRLNRDSFEPNLACLMP